MTQNTSDTHNLDFTSLVNQYQQKLYRVAYRIVGNGCEAQDIVQEAFLRAFQHIDQLEDPSRLEAWLYRITVNQCRSWLRRQRVRLRVLESQGMETDIPSMPPAPDEHLIRAELQERILNAIEQLPPRQREVVRLFYLEGQSYQSIQEHLGISKGLLGWRLREARQRLECKLREIYQAVVPGLMWKLRWSVPFSIPIKFMLLSLLLHLGLYVGLPRMLVRFADEQASAPIEVVLPVAFIEQGMIAFSGDGILPQRTRLVPKPVPLPRSTRIDPLPRTVRLPATSDSLPPHLGQDSPKIQSNSELSSPPPLSGVLGQPSRTMVCLPGKTVADARRPIGGNATELVSAMAVSAVPIQEPASSVREALIFSQAEKLFMVESDGSGKQEISLGQQAYHPWYSHISVTFDGARIAYSGVAPGIHGIWVKPLERSGFSPLPQGDLLTPDQEARSPVWSPDARQIAFVSTLVRRCEDIWVMQADGSLRRNLTKDTSSNKYPAWSPDHRFIAFSSTRPQYETGDIYVLELTTGERTQLTRDAAQDMNSTEPAWSPDGRTIAYTRSKKNTWTGSIFLMDADGKDKRELVKNANQPAWSPDGLQLVFVRNRGSQSEIWVVDADGENLRQVADEENLVGPQWVRLSTSASPVRERPAETPTILLPHQADTRIVFLQFISERELVTVRQDPSAEWYAEQRSLDAPDAIASLPVGIPTSLISGEVKPQTGVVTAVDCRGSEIAVIAWHSLSTGSIAHWWDSNRRHMANLPNDWSSLVLGPDNESLALIRGEMEVGKGTTHSSLDRFGKNVVLARYSPIAQRGREECRIVSAHSDGTLSVWDGWFSHRLIHQFPAHDAMIRDLVIFWKGDMMMSVSSASDGSIKLWNLSDATQLDGVQTKMVNHLAVSPDGQWLASAGEDITELWRLEPLERIRQLPGGGRINFSPDGCWLANVLDHSNIGIWDMGTPSE